MAITINELKATVEANHSRLSDKLDKEAKDLGDRIAENSEKIAAIEATIRTTKLISVSTAIIGTLIGALIVLIGAAGLNQYLKDREQLKVVLKTNALLTQTALVDKLEDLFQKIGSLDALKEKPEARAEIKSISSGIRQLSQNLEDNEQSTYYLVGDAIDIYLSNNCEGVVEILKRVKTADQSRLSYAYLRGACSLRLNNLADAEYWLGIAIQSKDSRQASVILNLQGVTSMSHARVNNNAELVAQAVRFFESSIETDNLYAPAHFNLACAHGYRQDFGAVSSELKKLIKELRQPVDTIVDRIRDDMARERFLQSYVQIHLKVTIPSVDPRWSQQMRAALHEL